MKKGITMKRIIAILLLLTLTLSLAACAEEGPVQYKEHFFHSTPEEMKDHKKILLEKEDFDRRVEEILNIRAYPNLMILDEEKNETIGVYIYDPETGMALGWTDLETGEKTLYEAGQEKNLGKPDPNKMVFFNDSIRLGVAVYEQKGVVTGAELYFFVSDTKDKDLLQEYLTVYHGETLAEESEGVYKIIKDAAAVAADFAAAEAAGATYEKKDAEEYVSLMKTNYGVAVISEE